MNTIKYSRLKVCAGIALAGLFVLAGVWVWNNFTGKGAFAMGLLAVIMPFIMLYLLRYLVDNRIAEFGRSSMKFYGFFGIKRVQYNQITDVTIETQSTTNVVGGRHLAFRIGNGSLGHPKISEWLLEGQHGKLDGVIDTFVQVRQGCDHSVTPARRQSGTPANAPQEHQPAPMGQRARTFGRKSV